MATNKQRRDAERRRLERQLEARRAREARRKRMTLIGSIAGTLAVIAVVIIVIVATSGSDGGKKKKAAADASQPAAPTSSAASSSGGTPCGQQQFPTKKVTAAKGASVKFMGATVKGAKDLTGKPGVTAKSAAVPTKLQYKDLVVGKGKAANPKSCVTVQYDGVLYKTGTEFDSSWKRGTLAQFPLTGVVPGFTQGIGGTTGVPPMKVGGRRIMILPSALGYGAQGSPPTIPANAALVFVVDLTNVSSAQAPSS